jgi:hypothetical protein
MDDAKNQMMVLQEKFVQNESDVQKEIKVLLWLFPLTYIYEELQEALSRSKEKSQEDKQTILKLREDLEDLKGQRSTFVGILNNLDVFLGTTDIFQ